MDALVLQDWLTVQTGSEPSNITQGAPGYLDVSDYQDLVFYLHVPTPIITGIPTFQYQTAPVAEESAFLTMYQTPASFTGGTRTDAILGSYSPIPPARYVRWVCAGNGYQCTFRILVAGYCLL